MNAMKRLGIGLAAVVLLFVPATNALASIVAIGPPVAGGSWAQQFAESGVGSFDTIIGVILTGGPFDPITETFPIYGSLPPGLSAPGWSSMLSGDAATATINGGPATSLNYFGTFAPDVVDPLSLIFYTYSGGSGGQLVDETLASWTGGPNGEWDFTTVPEPTTKIAGALLLLPLAVSTFRILRKRRTA